MVILKCIPLPTLCRPTYLGGLGLRDLSSNNLAFLAKMAWRIYSNMDSTLGKLVSAKYCIRNKFVFQNVSFDVDNVLHLAYSQALEYWIVSELPKVSDAIGKTVVNLNWKFPPSPWHKLNCDGASSFESFLAGAGSVICNSSGVFVAALAHHLPSNSSTVAELWVVRDGLLLALKLQISYLIVDSDSSSTISFETIRLPVIGI
ncbi:uncharacterized protein LOC113291626 [Papaver somniferum]|uniref:uncharacterized protein LOC113291626 n=1 Tax=Papaver somniferum TaxID=3469 RepID=UPI000E6FDAA1|nr:uncharacterized protein LOC113291626 [Papaver somniferum]